MLEAIGLRLERTLGGERVRRLHRARVALIGAGLLGGQIAMHLAMLQIRTLLVDPGRVEPENLGNQQLPASALGEPKVRARAEQMRALNPSCPLRLIEARVEDVGLGEFAGCDLLLTGLDSEASRLAVNRIAARLGIDWIDAAVDGSGERSYGTVSWMRPGRDDLGCYGCRFDPAALAAAAREARREPCRSWRGAAVADSPPTLTASPFGALIAGWQMTWAIRALLGEMPDAVGQQLQVSASGEPRARRIALARRPGCAFPHAPLAPLREAGCGTVGELLEVARDDLGAPPDALVLPSRNLVFGLACASCGARDDRVAHPPALRDDELRCGCGADAERAPIALGNRIDGPRLERLADASWASLGVPSRDLVTAQLGARRTHYLLPRLSAEETP